MRTKDEVFILCLYETALTYDEMSVPLDKYEIGKKCGVSPKAVDAICQLLMRSNFIKKSGEIDIYITKNGEALALSLLKEI